MSIKSNCIDLHIHTTCSDGTDRPEELVEKLLQNGISVFSVTDHDNVDFYKSIPDMPTDMVLYSGIEFSCRTSVGKCHILGYGMDIENESFKNAVQMGQTLRKNKLKTRLEGLEEQFGIVFSPEEKSHLSAMKNVGKPHLAQMIVNKGLSATIGEAITTYIKKIPSKNDRLDACVAINAIVAAGGIPVWAHPLGGEGEKILEEKDFFAQLNELKLSGIMGLECFYSRYGDDNRAFLLKVATDTDLLISGGSDYHGSVKNIPLGTLSADVLGVNKDCITALNQIQSFNK